MQQADDTQSQKDEEHALQDLECANDDEPTIVAMPRPAMLHL
jgi:hypothetical protein